MTPQRGKLRQKPGTKMPPAITRGGSEPNFSNVAINTDLRPPC
jgi:hypothetical protein